jgi:hypothetical protein
LSTAVDVILDTGTSLAYLGKKTGGKDVLKGMLSGIKHFKIFGSYYVSCDTTKYDSVFFALGGYWIEIPPATFIIDYGGSMCSLGIGLSSEWLLGDTLFRNYYNVFDEDNSQVGFAVRTGSSVTTAPYAA